MCTGATDPVSGKSAGTILENANMQHGVNAWLDPGGFFLKPPQAPLPEPPPTGPNINQLNAINYYQQQMRQRLQTQQGQQSTILTGPTGLGKSPLLPGMGNATAGAAKLAGV